MKMIKTAVSTTLIALALSGSVFAAENAEGVKEHMALTVEKAKAALASATAGNKDQCLADIKASKQHYKEITGDAAGKPLQDAIKTMKVGQEECEKGDTKKAAETLTGVVSALDKINAGVQSK
jgi:Small metal-binding protein